MWGSNCGIISVGSKISTMQSGSLICFRIGQMPVGAEGDRISSDKPSHIANLKVQPVLFHINISQRDQEPGLFCFTPGNKNTPTNWHWYNLQVMAACEPGMSEVCVCVCVSLELPSITGVVTGPKFTQKCVAWGREVLWPPLTVWLEFQPPPSPSLLSPSCSATYISQRDIRSDPHLWVRWQRPWWRWRKEWIPEFKNKGGNVRVRLLNNFPHLTVFFLFWVQWALSPHSKVLGTNSFGPDVNVRVHNDIQDVPCLVPEDRWNVGSSPWQAREGNSVKKNGELFY